MTRSPLPEQLDHSSAISTSTASSWYLSSLEFHAASQLYFNAVPPLRLHRPGTVLQPSAKDEQSNVKNVIMSQTRLEIATYQLNPMSPSGGGFGCGFSFLQGCGRLRVCSLSRDEKLGCSLPHPEPVVRGTCRSPAPASSSAASASLCWAGTTAGAGTWQKFCRLHVAGDNETCAVRAAWPPPVLPALQLSLAFWHF